MSGLHEHAMPAGLRQPKRETATPTLIHHLAFCYSRRVEMAEIQKNDFNLNISRYISTAVGEKEIVLSDVHADLVNIEKDIAAAKAKHNAFLTGLGLKPLP